MMITLDGSIGEGGGQILRTALSLSMVTGQPFRLQRIRAGRKKPGLLRQHLTAVQAAQEISRAKVEGAALGLGDLVFSPQAIAAGEYRFAVGSAGSATLVFQTILPALMTASGPSLLVLEGGTHNPLAPPFDFLARTFLPVINRMGPTVTTQIERHGFYPAGGGRMLVNIEPARALTPVELLERGPITHRQARVLLASLPRSVGERELLVVRTSLGWPEASGSIELVSSPGPGNALLLEIGTDHHIEVFAGFGERGVPAETVAHQTVSQTRPYLASTAPVGEHLADQLLIPLAMARSGAFKTLPLSRHTITNMEIINQFLPVEFNTEKHPDRSCTVRVNS